MSHTTHPNEPSITPSQLAQATTMHTQGNFRISSRKLPISKSGAIDAMSARLGIPVPEMIFGDNAVAIEHAPTGWRLEFAAEPALDRVDKTGRGMLRVAHAREWSSSREKTSAGIKEVVRPYDWSYSTTYRGTETPAGGGSEGDPGEEAKVGDEGQQRQQDSKSDQAQPPPRPNLSLKPDPSATIPLELLRRRDPILFADEVILYESELDDNGVSALSVKVRVMEARMLLLCRLFMRLDGVVCRVRDTRVYVDFAADVVVRDYTAKEDSCENVRRALLRTGLLPDAVIVAMRDPIKVDSVMPVVEHEVEGVTLSQR